ncbi:mRNA 3'-end-processing protein RNA14 [Smittium mucronatum]|uniref:mRNA 3'-end-processing protein RNA14 n=1 Tax=Smittium mucronatum TaxID=133383 RepID=A0A1R0GXA8_9FUNG|nr:mRNA 3'-end-processing protein RNA14 [Smittium mucronatum]
MSRMNGMLEDHLNKDSPITEKSFSPQKTANDSLNDPSKINGEDPQTFPPIDNISTAQVARSLINDEFKLIENKIHDSPYDQKAWIELITESKAIGEHTLIRSSYDRFLKQFPTSAVYWKEYLEFEYSLQNFPAVEKLFTLTIVQLYSIDLWMFYLDYVKQKNGYTLGSKIGMTSDQFKIIDESYSYCIKNFGIDRDSAQIWRSYIEFLEKTECFSAWEQSKKIESIRNLFHRAISIPLYQIELIWKEYDVFENNLNRLLAKKNLSDWSAIYMTARSALLESSKYIDSIKTHSPTDGLCVPILWTPSEKAYLSSWKKYISWEKTNPQSLESESELENRIVYIYDKSILSLRFYPEIWIESSQYLWKINRKKAAISKLNEAVNILPNDVHFQLAEFEELNNNCDECHQIFKKLLGNAETVLENKRKKIRESILKIENEIENLTTIGNKNSLVVTNDNEDDSPSISFSDKTFERSLLDDLGSNFKLDLNFEFKYNTSESKDENLSQAILHRRRKLEHLKTSIESQTQDSLLFERSLYSQIWIAYLRFSMRTQGIDGARIVFKSARSGLISNLTYHVFVASAMIEFHITKNPTIAGRLFELGLKYFGSEPKFVAEYMKYLINTNDGNNSRALFERSVTQKNPNNKPLWELFLNYEYQYGDLRTVYNLDLRYLDSFEKDSLVYRLINRYKFLDLNPMEKFSFGISEKEDEEEIPDDIEDSKPNLSNERQTSLLVKSQINQVPSENEVIVTAEELSGIKVGSIRNGKYLNRAILLSSVSGSKTFRPNISLWNNYKPPLNAGNSSAWNQNKPSNFDTGPLISNPQNFDEKNFTKPGMNLPVSNYESKIGRPSDSLYGSAENYFQIGDILSFLYHKTRSLSTLMLPALETNELLDTILNTPSIQLPETQSKLISTFSSTNNIYPPKSPSIGLNQPNNFLPRSHEGTSGISNQNYQHDPVDNKLGFLNVADQQGYAPAPPQNLQVIGKNSSYQTGLQYSSINPLASNNIFPEGSSGLINPIIDGKSNIGARQQGLQKENLTKRGINTDGQSNSSIQYQNANKRNRFG